MSNIYDQLSSYQKQMYIIEEFIGYNFITGLMPVINKIYYWGGTFGSGPSWHR